MAFDGITIANIVLEYKERLQGGRIYKIAQPEKDELLITIKANGEQHRLFISAGASLPLTYLTDYNKVSPMTAPNFCMLLRKHIQNAKIINITQPSLERIIKIELEHLNELGDLCRKFLMIELMGKHSNIIFCKEDDTIIDSIKHISGMVSSVREVLPGREYFIPQTQEKSNPLQTTKQEFLSLLISKDEECYKGIFNSYTGISPLLAKEICYLAKISNESSCHLLNDIEMEALWNSFCVIIERVKLGDFQPEIILKDGEVVEYASFPLKSYQEHQTEQYTSISTLLETYYRQKNSLTRIRQKSSDLRRIVQTALGRNYKKYDIQIKQMKDTDKKDKFRIYGELLNTYGYEVEEGATFLEALNYYTDEMIKIPLDPNDTAAENAKKYFDKYAKMKRTFKALTTLTEETNAEIEHLESISTSLEIALQENDLVQIKEELIENGYIRKKPVKKKIKITSKPFHYISSDGFHIYVGKNNYQNDELTFQFANGSDWWFHAKGIPGSHVIVKSKGEELPDKTFEEAGKLAAYYSKGKGCEKVEIDYTEKKNVKRPSGGKPGFVIYYTNFSMHIHGDITEIEEIKEV